MTPTATAEQIDTDVSVLRALDAAACADLPESELTEHLLELHRLKARVDGALSAATGAFDAKKTWTADGARSGAGWLAARVDLSRKRSASEIDVGPRPAPHTGHRGRRAGR